MGKITIKYKGHDIRHEPTQWGEYAVYESGDADNTLLWRGDSVDSCKATIDEVLEDMDEVTP